MMEAVNEYGVPLSACWGHAHNAHYWAWVGYKHSLDACRIAGCVIHTVKGA